jgi:succinoglycan biosynthesis transport protein ExoP
LPEQQLAEPLAPPSVLDFLRRRLLAIVIPALIVPAVAIGLSLREHKEYQASTSLLFRDTGIGSQVLASQDPVREAATNLRLLQLGVLDNRVNARLGKPFTGSIEVVTEADSNLATITITDTNPKRAARVANLYAGQYIALRREKARQEVDQERRSVLGAIAKIPSDQQGGPEALALQGRLQKLAVAAVAPSGVIQVKPAQPPSSPSSPHPLRNGLIGGLIGLALGIAFAIWLERHDRRVRDPRYVESVFDSPIIGRIPQSKALAKVAPGITPLPPPEAEAFRALRANLHHLVRSGGVRSTLVTSADSGDGKTTIAWNLARAEAMSGAKVLLIEADMRRPLLAISLGANGARGLSQFLTGNGRMQDLIQPISFWDSYGSSPSGAVDVLFAGARPANPSELLASERMQRALEGISVDYDLVVVDTPAAVVSDAMPILAVVGGVVVVSRLGVSTAESIMELRDQLEKLDARTIGVVVNSDTPNASGRKYYV